MVEIWLSSAYMKIFLDLLTTSAISYSVLFEKENADDAAEL